MAKKVPIVAIVGRANVGKSSLFNAILDRREAIVANEPGTTRDSIMAKAEYDDHDFWLVDTAGVKNPEDDFEFTIQEQIEQAAADADIIWVMVEANVPITEEDRRVAKLALKSRKPVFLVVNKIDKARKQDVIGDFVRLGIKDIIGTSATHKEGVQQLLDKLVAVIPQASIVEDDNRIHIALLGRPNVGKSALFNALSKKQQAIVAPRAGTTRDINRTIVRYQGQEIEIMDTAGIRRPGKIGKGIEHFSVVRTLSAIEQADICFLLMDVNELSVALDQKIAGMIKEAGKGLVLVVSKWDDKALTPVTTRASKTEAKLAAKAEEIEAEKLSKSEKKRRAKAIHYTEEGSIERTSFTRDALAARIGAEYDFVPWAPLIFTSSITGQNVTKLFDLALQITEARKIRIGTRALNDWLRMVVAKHPPAGLKNRAPKLNYIVQEEDNATPAFKIFGSHTKFVHWSYRRYLERELRQSFNFDGTALQIWFIEKHITHKHGNSPTKADRSDVQRAIIRKKAPRTSK